MAYEQKEAREQKTEHHDDAEAALQDEGDELHKPCQEQHRLIAVAQWHVAAGYPPGCHGYRERQERQAEQYGKAPVCQTAQSWCDPSCLRHAADDVEQGDEAQGEVHHEEHRGEGHCVAQPFCLVLCCAGQTVTAEHLLVVMHLVEKLIDARPPSCDHILGHQREDLVDVERLLRTDVVGQTVGGSIPGGDAALCGVGQEVERLSAAQLHEKHQTVVKVHGLFVQFVSVALVVFLHERPQCVLAHLEEGGHRAVAVCKSQVVAQLTALDTYERFAGPLVTIENPACEHLLGREPLVGACTVDLLAEVERIGLYRADAVVVEHAETAQSVGRLKRYCRLCL